MGQPFKVFDPAEAAPVVDGFTVGDAVNLYLQFLSQRVADDKFSQEALSARKRRLDSFTAWNGNGERAVADCKQFHFTNWWQSHFDTWLADSTRRDAMDAVLACFRWAEDEELIDRNPFRKPRGIKLSLRKLTKIPIKRADYLALHLEALTCRVRRPHRSELPEFRRRLRHGSHALRAGIFFLYWTGARPAEMWRAEWRDFDGASIKLHKHKTSRATGKARIIGLIPRLRAFLERRRARIDPAPTDRIFLNTEGQPWNKDTWSRHFSRHADKAGFEKKLSSYCLRHGWITDAVKSGIDSRWIADQAGHSTTRMIDEVYAVSTRDDPAHLNRVAEEAARKRRKD